MKYRKKSEIIGKYRKLSKKIGKNRRKEISVEISFRSPPISDISPIFWPKYLKFCSLLVTILLVIITFVALVRVDFG